MVGWMVGWLVGWLDGTEIFEYTPDRSGPKTRATRGQASLHSEIIWSRDSKRFTHFDDLILSPPHARAIFSGTKRRT